MNYSGCQFDGIGIFTLSVHKRYRMPLNFSHIQPYIRFYRTHVCGLVTDDNQHDVVSDKLHVGESIIQLGATYPYTHD
jgi:hypothetical protein